MNGKATKGKITLAFSILLLVLFINAVHALGVDGPESSSCVYQSGLGPTGIASFDCDPTWTVSNTNPGPGGIGILGDQVLSFYSSGLTALYWSSSAYTYGAIPGPGQGSGIYSAAYTPNYIWTWGEAVPKKVLSAQAVCYYYDQCLTLNDEDECQGGLVHQSTTACTQNHTLDGCAVLQESGTYTLNSNTNFDSTLYD